MAEDDKCNISHIMTSALQTNDLTIEVRFQDVLASIKLYTAGKNIETFASYKFMELCKPDDSSAFIGLDDGDSLISGYEHILAGGLN